jgi:hypothetical protein
LLAGIVSLNPAGARMFVSCEFGVLPGKGLCVGLITRKEESLAPLKLLRHGKKNMNMKPTIINNKFTNALTNF